MLFQASPIYPPHVSRKMIHFPELNDFVTTNSDCILHVQCDSDNSAIAQSIYDYLKTSAKTPRRVLYFQFNSRDIRFNNISAMIATFIAQLAYASIGSLTEDNRIYLNRLLAHRAWSLGDLNYCWENFHKTIDDFDIFYVLGEFDQCDESRRWFLNQLNSTMRNTESRFKIVIVSTVRGKQNISLHLSEFPVEAYQEILVESIILLEPITPVGTDLEVAMLLHERPQYIACESRIHTLIRACAGDLNLCRVVIQWLRSSKKPCDAIEADLDNMTAFTPAAVCASILQSVPDKRHDWARMLISWVLLAVRPLRVEEFCVVSKLALKLKQKTRHQPRSRLLSLASDLDQIHSWLPGIFTVDHDEVHLSHPCLHVLLEAGSHQAGPVREWYQSENNSQGHLDILEICLAFLSLPTMSSSTQVLPSSEPLNTPAVALPEKREPHQLPYAIQYWAKHYQLYKTSREECVDVIEDGISTLLRDQSIRQRWQERYNQLANPFLRPREPFQTPLSVAAHFGLDDLVEVFQPEFRQESSLALVEAAQNGHVAAVRQILQSPALRLTFDNAFVRQALMVAMATGADDSIMAILKHVKHSKHLHHEQPHVEHPWLSPILCRAAYLGLAEVVQAILRLGAEVDPVNVENGRTPLYFAALGQHHATAKVLLDAGASLTATSSDWGSTPLRAAAALGSPDVTRLLLEHGAKPEAKDAHGMTPLQTAYLWGRHAAVAVLLNHKRFQEYHDPGEVSEDQPLLLAVQRGNAKTVDSLLRHDADPNVRDRDGTSLFHAVSQRRIDICHLLLAKKADVNYVVPGSYSALIEAVQVGDVDIVNLLLDHQADTEKTEADAGESGNGNGWRRTALHVAACHNERELVRVLLAHGANPNVCDSDGWTSVWAAAYFGHADIVRLLIDAEADIHIAASRQQTPLHVAYQSPDVVRILVEHGADVNKSSDLGTPLAIAAQDNQHEVVKLILRSKNPPLDLANEASQAALLLAVRNGYREIVNHMLEAGADVNRTDEFNRTLVSIAISQSNEVMVRTILEFNPDLDLQDIDGNTLLHHIGDKTPVASVRLAVNAGAKVNRVNKDGDTPLHAAIDFSTLEVVEYLLSKNADVNSHGGGSVPPLHHACHRRHFGMVSRLIDSGANINFPSAGIYGTPMIAACLGSIENSEEEKFKIIRLLLEKGGDINLYAGVLGYAILAASMASSAAVVQYLVEEGAILGVKDEMGRNSVHLASYNSIANLNAIGAAKRSFTVKDKCGRVALHYAAASGQLDLVQHVFTRSETEGVRIDEPDDDDWTPLLWAVRTARLWAHPDRSRDHLGIVNFLLENGANPEAHGKGIDRDWLLQEVAIYHQAPPTVVAAINSRLAPQRFHGQYKKGLKATNFYCEFCLMVNLHLDLVVRLH